MIYRWSMTKTLCVLALIAGGSLFTGACVPRSPAMRRVGIIRSTGAFVEIRDGFKSKMGELGYVEGRNITYDDQDMKNDPAEARRIAGKFAVDKVDVIFALSTTSALAAKAATAGTGTPVVFAYAAVEGTDLVESVRRPGGNITGVRYPGPETISKRLELMLEIAPRVRRVWICYDRNNPNNFPALVSLRQTASSSGVTLVEVAASAQEEVAADLRARAGAGDSGMDAMILMPDGFNHSPAGLAIIGDFVRRRKMPLGGSFSYTMEAGSVFGNADNLTRVGELAAPLVEKIFKGVPAGTIPVVTPVQGLWINFAMAQKLGLSVPDGMLKLADTIIR